MHRYLRRLVRVLAVVALGLLVFVGWQGVRVWLAWRSIDRIDLDLAGSRGALATMPPLSGTSDDDFEVSELDVEVAVPDSPQDVFDDDDVDVYVLVGTDVDKLQGLEEEGFVVHEGEADPEAVGDADAILLFLRPHGGADPLLISLPRDLLLVNPCTRRPTRLVATLEGCGDAASGPELLALIVEDFTTLSVDHLAVLSFGAFTQVIDRLGGLPVCVEADSQFDALTLEAGCTVVDGVDALRWVRSRSHLELVDGEWRAADAGDLARSRRQQAILIELLGRLKRFKSPLELANLVGDLADAVAVDAGLSIPEAIDIAWELRSIAPSSILRPELPVEGRTLRGKFVWVATEPFIDVLASAYGE